MEQFWQHMAKLKDDFQKFSVATTKELNSKMRHMEAEVDRVEASNAQNDYQLDKLKQLFEQEGQDIALLQHTDAELRARDAELEERIKHYENWRPEALQHLEGVLPLQMAGLSFLVTAGTLGKGKQKQKFAKKFLEVKSELLYNQAMIKAQGDAAKVPAAFHAVGVPLDQVALQAAGTWTSPYGFGSYRLPDDLDEYLRNKPRKSRRSKRSRRDKSSRGSAASRRQNRSTRSRLRARALAELQMGAAAAAPPGEAKTAENAGQEAKADGAQPGQTQEAPAQKTAEG